MSLTPKQDGLGIILVGWGLMHFITVSTPLLATGLQAERRGLPPSKAHQMKISPLCAISIVLCVGVFLNLYHLTKRALL